MLNNDNPLGPISGPLQEIAQMMRATDEWQAVRQAMIDAYERTGEQEAVVTAGRQALSQVGWDGTSILSYLPAPYDELVPEDQRAKAAEVVDLYMIGSVAQEIVTGEPLPLLPLAGGNVRVEWLEVDETRYPVVHAYVTPLGDPEQIAELLLDQCYRVFDSDTFAKHTVGARDAEWWTRWKRGQQFRDIALDDKRSGLAPEALATPDQYPDEIAKATDTVRRAVKRFDKRWTQKLDSLSKLGD